MEVWLHSFARPRRTAEAARRAETLGYTGMLVADSQNLTPEAWVELAFAPRPRAGRNAGSARSRRGPPSTGPALAGWGLG
jgi:hypothetical protein